MVPIAVPMLGAVGNLKVTKQIAELPDSCHQEHDEQQQERVLRRVGSLLLQEDLKAHSFPHAGIATG